MKVSFLKRAIEEGLIFKLGWLDAFLTKPMSEDYEGKYIAIRDGKLFGKVNEEEFLLLNKIDRPPLMFSDKITVDKIFSPFIKSKTETTVGILLANFILVEYPFKGKIDYINKPFSVDGFEKEYIVKRLTDSPNPGPSDITIEENILFANAVTYIKNITRYSSVTVTRPYLTPSKGIEKFKKDLKAELIAKHGKDPFKDVSVSLEFDRKVKVFEDNFMKEQDPTGRLGRIGKVGKVRKKLMSAYGLGETFNPGDTPRYIDWGLIEGYSKDKKDLVTLFNDARIGSYMRGKQTAEAGSAAKDSLRAAGNIKILEKDCGTEHGEEFLVDKHNYTNLIGRYMMTNGTTKDILEDNVKSLIGKTISVRSPLTCKENIHCCKFCLDKKIESYEYGIPEAVTNIGGLLLNETLAAMHSYEVNTAEVRILDLVN